jgi:hypothetical protein
MGQLDRVVACLLVVVVSPAAFLRASAPRAAAPSGFTENFDGVTPPALPAGWATAHSPGAGALWVTDTANPDTAPNVAHLSEGGAAPFQDTFDSPPISIVTSSAQLWFRHSFQFFVDLGGLPQKSSPTEYCYSNQYDAYGTLQISMNGGAFQDIQAAGGSFLAGGYTNGGASWVCYSLGYLTVVVNLPVAAAGTTVVLRWYSAGSPGLYGGGADWLVDSIQICDGYPCDAVPLPTRLDVDTQGNGVLEPGETVDLDTYYYNNGALALDLTGGVGNLDGPPGTVFQSLDSFATFGTISPGASGGCIDTADCYLISLDVPAARPAQHWDGQFWEDLSNGQVVNWALHVGESFLDVPTSNPFYAFIENVFHNRVTGGCAAGDYCPDNTTLRKQMAVFVLKAKYGSAYVPPHCAGVFTDVACPGPFTDWIEDLHNQGVVAGCGAGPTYCPDGPVLRQQMAVFLLKTLEGPSYVPPACLGLFLDVPCSSAFAPWIEDLWSRQIAAGCGNSDFCPTDPTTRGQMAPLLVKTFGLLLYGY